MADANRIIGNAEGNLNQQQELIVKKITERAESLRQGVNELLDEQLTAMRDQCKAELLQPASVSTKQNSKEQNKNNAINQSGRIREKEFATRNSLLTDLFEIDHIKTIHHIFVVLFILLFTSNVLCTYSGFIKSIHNLSLIQWNFSKLDIVLFVWVAMQLAILVVLYNGFTIWASNRHIYRKPWDYFWLSSFMLYLAGLFYYPARSIVVNSLPPASTCIIIGEQIRGIMKSYAFVRANAAKVLEQAKHKTENYQPPTFSAFLYYYFVPTLVYRDKYPRTSNTRWNFVVKNFCQIIGCVLFLYFMFGQLIITFENFGNEPISIPKYIIATFNSVLPAIGVLLSIFYLLLHLWMNVFAEILRFGDRQFYQDWWNCTHYSSFYRKWNIIVHDFLYTYVFKDICKVSSSRLVATLTVFAISAIIHEYILTLIFGFFFPVMLILFGGFGVVFTFVPTSKNNPNLNIMFWLSYSLGSGIMMSLYSMEWFARKNCPPYANPDLDFVIPRIWVCYNTQIISNGTSM